MCSVSMFTLSMFTNVWVKHAHMHWFLGFFSMQADWFVACKGGHLTPSSSCAHQRMSPEEAASLGLANGAQTCRTSLHRAK
ncbi:hypothetical protein DUNSADRAFT_7276 [Dunaliella salina]|uniref:Secreted protein n=1 Tax=Dunaliella salina TaxID=3046 RepID=A0ABQ7FTQ9_DUNSA|nr:hypothetical protein DUNSADRAFT_7276 [Dunaliella salina]|eukprot:KAF5825730.1 hypothetical protein DUNSADRAFT_7276 [Dunaliella salina]